MNEAEPNTQTKRWFEVKYSSQGNAIMDNDIIFIYANDIVEAQDLFINWLRGTELYSHMWNLQVQFAKGRPPIVLGAKVT